MPGRAEWDMLNSGMFSRLVGVGHAWVFEEFLGYKQKSDPEQFSQVVVVLAWEAWVDSIPLWKEKVTNLNEGERTSNRLTF